jgi:hypothetical protein
MRCSIGHAASVIAFIAFAPLPLIAQSDRAAGLFTEAQQLPMVSQSVVVRIHGPEATIELTQVFANDGPAIAQADYRLHLPQEAVVTGFGFWFDGRFHAAELKERQQARSEHAVAAGEGRATGLLERNEGAVHSFSVFPVPEHALQEVALTMVVPVTTERGRNHVRLPLDSFLGHSRLTSVVTVKVNTDEPLLAVGVHGATATERRRTKRAAELVFSTAEPVEVWWASELPPLLTRAESVPTEDGSDAIQLRLALNEATAGDHPAMLALLVDGSYSMRRRSGALVSLLERIDSQSPAAVRVFAIAERVIEVSGDEATSMVRRAVSGTAGHSATWQAFEHAAETLGCTSDSIRCIAITDPQILDLDLDRTLEAIFLADADELAFFGTDLGRSAMIHQPQVEPRAMLHSLADELVLPVLAVTGIEQGGAQLMPVGHPRMRVAQGGMLRLYLASPSSEPLTLAMTVDGREMHRTVHIEPLDPLRRAGRSVRRGFYRSLLHDWIEEYRRGRDPELKRQIVEVSVREEIPTPLTALHVAAPDRVLPRTATWAPLSRWLGVALLVLAGALWRLRE